ncbi:MAG: molecular chaperone DnaK [Verrucomicrobia bacterium]|nr:molecular chaperone DnaK [Verrucomicrobiota bacterium]
MSRIVGIDLGTTNSLVASVDSGFPFVIPDREGHRLTPSVVHFPDDSGPALVGHKAQRLRVLKPAETVYSVKRFMGRRGNEISREQLRVNYPLRTQSSEAVGIDIRGRVLKAEDVSAEVLKKLKADAETYFGEPVTRAVITVPAYFNDAQRSATKRAGELAGLTVERIINEPTAAALAYGLDKLKERSKIAVYDLGGGTFDLSILELTEGVFQVLATHGDTLLGGDDLDKRIVDWLVERIRKAGGPDATQEPGLMARLREAAEETKIKLSDVEEASVSLPFLDSQFSFTCPFTRRELEELTRDIIVRTREHCLRSLADAKLEPADLDQVILVGGQTRMPLVRRFAAELFHCAEFEVVAGALRVGSDYHKSRGPALNTSQNPDEAVALGAAIQAEILAGGFKNLLLLDVTPLSLGIETFGGLMNVIITRNSTIPIKAGEVFTTAVDHQTAMLIHVLQGERERARDNWSLGRFTLDFERAPKGVARVGVQFEIDANGILRVLARDLKSGRQTVVDLKSAVDVNDAEVEKMVEESVEHAFEDLAARRWIEARLRAGDTVEATRKALAECGAEIAADLRTRIDAAVLAVTAALDTEDPTTQAGNLNQINAAIAELDDATKPLADLLMQRAMEAALRRRGLIQG